MREVGAVWQSDQILKALDDCAQIFYFPMLDNGYVYLAATRLSLFRSSEDWAMTIEVFGYSPRAGIPDTTIYTFGGQVSRLRREMDSATSATLRTDLSVHPYDEMNIVYPIESGEWQDASTDDFVALGRNLILLRSETLLTPELTEYPHFGISIELPPRVCVFELCRFLAAIRRDKVLATPQERRECVPDGLSQILQLEEWHHPDLANSEPPSSTETFRQLADVLVFGEPSRYRPTLDPNTDWQNWPDGGTL
jgi:hypothetical protein